MHLFFGDMHLNAISRPIYAKTRMCFKKLLQEKCHRDDAVRFRNVLVNELFTPSGNPILPGKFYVCARRSRIKRCRMGSLIDGEANGKGRKASREKSENK